MPFILILNHMPKKHFCLLAAVAWTVLMGMNGFASSGADVLVLGTATPGGGFPVYGEALSEAVNQADPSLNVEARHTRGSTENVPMLEAGRLDIALVQGEVAVDAFRDAVGPSGRPKIIAAMYSTAGIFAVRADSPFRTIESLRGSPVAFGARGSGLVILARYVLTGIGLDPDRDFQAIYLDRAGDGPRMVADGRAAALWGGGIGWPGFIAVADAPGGARFIAPGSKEIDMILVKYPSLRRITVPAGSYPGQVEPIESVGSWSFVLARSTLPESVAYRLARALHRGHAVMAKRLAQARETTPENTVKAAPRLDLIHPGAQRYLKEIGLIQ
jgi:uncharacterized protein